MTTTDVYQGATEGKPSSRVLAPPGGGSSDIFGTGMGAAPPAPRAGGRGCQGNQRNQSSILYGGGEEPEQPAQRSQKRNESNIFGAPPPETKASPARGNKSSDIFGENKPEEARQKPKAQGGVNPITGESYGAAQPNEAHTSTRTRQPPGGKSSGLW